MKKIVMTGGGTSGHVTPNIALMPGLKKRGYEIYYIGSKNGIEKQLIEKEGIEYYSINTGKLRRYFDLKNFTDIFRVVDGLRQAVAVLGRLKPDIVYSKGGFVSCPVVWAAWFRKIPVVIHESDYTPGLTNKLSIPFAKKVCYTFPESINHLPKEKSVLTGIPIRENLLAGSRSEGRKICGFNSSKPVIMIIGGSQGSERINKITRNVLDTLLKQYNICHVCGKGNMDDKYNYKEGYRQFEYVNEEIAHLFALADIVISRAGATALHEILALKKPALLIPLSRQASRGDQILNARSFEKLGYSSVLMEEELSDETYLNGIFEMYKERSKYISAMKYRNELSGSEAVIKVLEENS